MYLPIVIIQGIKEGTEPIMGVLMFIQNFIFSGSYYHLWFLPSLIFACSYVSLIRNMKKIYAVLILSGLFIIGLLFEAYRFLVPQCKDLFDIYGKIFITTRNGLFFGSIYVYLGYIFTQHDIKKGTLKWLLGETASLLLLCMEAILMYLYSERTMMNLSIFALPAAVFAFIISRNLDVNIQEDKLCFFRKLSTALLCEHPIIISGIYFINEYFMFIPAGYAFVLVMIISTISSVIIVKLSEKYRLMSNLV